MKELLKKQKIKDKYQKYMVKRFLCSLEKELSKDYLKDFIDMHHQIRLEALGAFLFMEGAKAAVLWQRMEYAQSKI